MLETWDFGYIRIIPAERLTRFDRYIRDDVLGEWSYYQLTSGEIVATHNWEEEE